MLARITEKMARQLAFKYQERNVYVELTSDFEQIIIDRKSLVDVRAPIEFSNGSIVGAINLPLMNDEERHRVGTCYRVEGGEAALALGNDLVSGKIREERIAGWLGAITQHPDLILYCSRGGLRSEIVQKWIKDQAGILVPRISGGYKRFRNFLLSRLDPAAVHGKPVVLGGRTGSGKTILLNQLENGVDLEAIAHHRGSSFGHFITAQPTQADFENRLAAALINHGHKQYPHIIVEDEGRHVGRCYMPRGLSDFFSAGELVVLETPISERIQITYDEYVIGGQQAYCDCFGSESGLQKWQTAMEENSQRIVKRLGSERFRQLQNMLADAQQEQYATGDPCLHKRWVEMLILDYYDPMYDYQLAKDNRTVVFRGDSASVFAYLQSRR